MPTFKFKNTIYFLLATLMLITSSCNSKGKLQFGDADKKELTIRRYDRLQSRYLTTGDFSAVQEMSIEYPLETRTLIEDVIQVGKVTDPDINTKFLKFFHDSMLQELISDTELYFADMSDITKQFNKVFKKMKKELPFIHTPDLYAQISGLNQSIVVNNKSIGISIDKYLGSDYHIYQKFYSESQRKEMTKDYIVPDAVAFYLISIYPMNEYNECEQIEKDLYMGKIFWAANYFTGKKYFNSTYIRMVNNYMDKYRNINIGMLLENNDYDEIIKINRE